MWMKLVLLFNWRTKIVKLVQQHLIANYIKYEFENDWTYSSSGVTYFNNRTYVVSEFYWSIMGNRLNSENSLTSGITAGDSYWYVLKLLQLFGLA